MPSVTTSRVITVDQIPDGVITGVKVAAHVIGSTALKSRAVGSMALGSAVIARTIRSRAVGSSALGTAIIKRTMYGSPVDYTKAYHIQQRGSVKVRAYATPGSYTAFPTAYGSLPMLGLEPGTPDGIGISFYQRDRLRPGSFSIIGSPLGRYLQYSAFGFR
jgi:hypothetical protein